MDAFHVLKVFAGAVIAVSVSAHIVRSLVIPRARRTLLTRLMDAAVDALFRVLVRPFADYYRKDQILAVQGSVLLLVQLATWLFGYLIAFSLMLWSGPRSFPAAMKEIGSSMFTLGFIYNGGGTEAALDILAACFGLVVVALQIAYLPTLYAAFSRRETEVTLLAARAGMPQWGPELLVRTRYGVATKTDDLPALYDRWERWAADVAESHSNYPVLVRFRSPQPLMSWLVALLAVMDSAAMLLSLCPSRERMEPRRALRMGFTALRQIGGAMGLPVDLDPDPDAEIDLTFAQFSEAVDTLKSVGFPVEREAAEAWPHFRGWRVNYEALAYGLAERTDAVPAPWSGPRRWRAGTIPVQRPANRRPSDAPGSVMPSEEQADRGEGDPDGATAGAR
ncbi:MAG TPA: hypothetical protein VME20_05615 [Acidimicrobiales bacterium]|nr:hypothetical protein [Acidimicrobiales bacterium]